MDDYHAQKVKAKAKLYYERHKEERKAKAKIYAETHKAEIAAKTKAYYEAHKVYKKEPVQAFRERVEKQLHYHIPTGLCAHCHQPVPATSEYRSYCDKACFLQAMKSYQNYEEKTK